MDGTLEDARGLAAMGAWIEHSVCMFLEGCKFKSREEEDLRAFIEAAGVGRTIMASDLGQVGTFHPIEGFRRTIKLLIDWGYSDEDIRRMVSLNAAEALGIEADLPQKPSAGSGMKSPSCRS